MHKILKQILFFPVLYISLSCIQKEQNIENTAGTSPNKTTVNKHYKPLFLGLYPEMTDVEYQNQIKKLNQKGTLYGSLFTIASNENFPEFNIKKEFNSIRLWYKEFNTYKSDELDREFSKELVDGYKLKKDEILKVYSKKYEQNDWQFPKGVYLPEYNLPQDEYIIFKDADKYIVIGYTLKGIIYKTREERIAEDIAAGKDVNPLDPIYGSFRSEHVFGLSVDIHYFNKFVLKELVDVMKKDAAATTERVRKEMEIHDAQQKAFRKNIDEI